MANSTSASSHQSYGSRVGNSLRNILVGIVLVIGSIVLLACNEKRYLNDHEDLDFGEKNVNETISSEINPDLEGKEVHLYGEITSNAEALKDDAFGIITDDLKLKRTVEMYQWFEESHEECHDNYGGSRDCDAPTYTYNTEWSEYPIDSSNFNTQSGHANPSTREYESSEREKSPITLGAYTLASVFTNQLKDYKTINLSEQNVILPENSEIIPDPQPQENETTTVEDNNNSYLYGNSQETTTTVTSKKRFHINGNQIYIGEDPTKPSVGDLRITYSSVKPGTISIVGKQMGNELTSYKAPHGKGINLLEHGNVSAEDMFLNAQEATKTRTWILRLLGLILMYAGFSLMFQFIETIAKVLPFLADIIGVGTSIIALGLTLIVGFLTIGIAWLVVRPIVGICCLVVAAGGIFLLKKAKKTKNDNLPKQEYIEKKPEPTEEIIE